MLLEAAKMFAIFNRQTRIYSLRHFDLNSLREAKRDIVATHLWFLQTLPLPIHFGIFPTAWTLAPGHVPAANGIARKLVQATSMIDTRTEL